LATFFNKEKSMEARKVFLKPEIQSYNQATLNQLVGPIITQYGPPPPTNSPPQLMTFTCSPEVPFNNECPKTLPRIQVKFDWQKIVGDMVGGKKCYTYIYPAKSGQVGVSTTCAPLTDQTCVGGKSGQCVEILEAPELIPVTIDFFIQDKEGNSSNPRSCVISPPC
jgi:hypothetical protein